MFAVIKTGGKQYKISEGSRLLIEKLEREIGAEFDFDQILLVSNDSSGSPQVADAKNVKIGTPLVEGAKVHARVLEHGKGEKKVVFKYSSKTRYKKKKGHRQPYTKIEILKIIA